MIDLMENGVNVILQLIFNLQNRRPASIIKALNPLSKDLALTRWIKHPHAVVKRSPEYLIRIPSFFVNHWGTGREPKKTPQLCNWLTGTHCFAATRSTLSFSERVSKMVYKFLIAHRRATVAQINSLRFITVQADSEHLARSKFANLPLVFVSCTQQGAAV